MGKANVKGRSKDRFLIWHRGVWTSEAWQSLSCEARALFFEVAQRHTGKNNGSIPFSWREARESLSIGQRKVKQAFADLQDRGFLIAKQPGSFDWKGDGADNRATRWEITTEACDGQPAKARYREWRPQEIQNAGTAVVPNGYRPGTDDTPQPPISEPDGYRPGIDSAPSGQPDGYHCGSGITCHVGAKNSAYRFPGDAKAEVWNPSGRVVVVRTPYGPGSDPFSRTEVYRGAA